MKKYFIQERYAKIKEVGTKKFDTCSIWALMVKNGDKKPRTIKISFDKTKIIDLMEEFEEKEKAKYLMKNCPKIIVRQWRKSGIVKVWYTEGSIEQEWIDDDDCITKVFVSDTVDNCEKSAIDWASKQHPNNPMAKALVNFINY